MSFRSDTLGAFVLLVISMALQLLTLALLIYVDCFKERLRDFGVWKTKVVIVSATILLTLVCLLGIFYDGDTATFTRGFCTFQGVSINFAYLLAASATALSTVTIWRKVVYLQGIRSRENIETYAYQWYYAVFIVGVSSVCTGVASIEADWRPQSMWCWIDDPTWAKVIGLYLPIFFLTIIGTLPALAVMREVINSAKQTGASGRAQGTIGERVISAYPIFVFAGFYFVLNLIVLIDRVVYVSRDGSPDARSEPSATEYACGLLGFAVFFSFVFQRRYLPFLEPCLVPCMKWLGLTLHNIFEGCCCAPDPEAGHSRNASSLASARNSNGGNSNAHTNGSVEMDSEADVL